MSSNQIPFFSIRTTPKKFAFFENKSQGEKNEKNFCNLKLVIEKGVVDRSNTVIVNNSNRPKIHDCQIQTWSKASFNRREYWNSFSALTAEKLKPRLPAFWWREFRDFSSNFDNFHCFSESLGRVSANVDVDRANRILDRTSAPTYSCSVATHFPKDFSRCFVATDFAAECWNSVECWFWASAERPLGSNWLARVSDFDFDRHNRRWKRRAKRSQTEQKNSSMNWNHATVCSVEERISVLHCNDLESVCTLLRLRLGRLIWSDLKIPVFPILDLTGHTSQKTLGSG